MFNSPISSIKAKRKAILGDFPKLLNLPRNWIHQGLTYMDVGELVSRIVIEYLCIVLCITFFERLTNYIFIAFIFVHTCNWIFNGLFWSVILFTFPSMHNQGAEKTVEYLNNMRRRIELCDSISGVLIYGSISRRAWHDRSDVDIRFLRKQGLVNLFFAVFVTMRERFIAFICKQPIDLYLADDVYFLKKMRADEFPLFLICRDTRLNNYYNTCTCRDINIKDLIA